MRKITKVFLVLTLIALIPINIWLYTNNLKYETDIKYILLILCIGNVGFLAPLWFIYQDIRNELEHKEEVDNLRLINKYSNQNYEEEIKKLKEEISTIDKILQEN